MGPRAQLKNEDQMPTRLIRIVLLALTAAVTLHAQTVAPAPAFRARADAIATEIFPAVVTTRRDLHQHPELGFRETRTAAIVADRLRALKFDEVRTGVGVTGVVGVLRGGKPGPVVAIRTDMDALPIPELIDVPYKSLVANVKHACGHAEILSRLRADVAGTVVFLFQPAEEGDPDGGTTGAVRVLADWPLTNPTPQVIFGLHLVPMMPVGTIGVNSGAAMASSDRITITIRGKATHGAMPHTGIDPIPIASQVVMALQTIPSRQMNAQEPTVVTIGQINGGLRYNVIADSVTMTGTVRSLAKDGPANVKAKMTSILNGITSSYGASYTLDYVQNAPVTYNDPTLAAASSAALTSAFGADRVLAGPPQMVSEDFAYYQQRIPGFYFFVGVGNVAKGITAMWHTEYYDMDEEGLRVGMRAMATVVLDYLQRPR